MFLSQQDIITGLIALGIIAIATLLVQVGIKRQWLAMEYGRKLLHVVAIVTCAWAIHRFENLQVLAWLFLLFAGVLALALRKGFMQVGPQRSYGIALFPLAFFVLLLCPWLERETVVLAVLVLAISDAAAGWVGSRFANRHPVFLYETKSWLGCGAFFITAMITALVYNGSFEPGIWLFCYCFALVPALAELFSYKGSDNFTVPIMTAVWYGLLQYLTWQHLIDLAWFSVLLLLLSLAAIHRKWLQPSGAAAAALLGLLFFAADGYRAMALPVLFLVTGSLFSKLNGEKAESQGRSAVQVFANGAVGAGCWVLYKITGQQMFALAASMSFALAMSDTVSAELGKYWKGRTYDLLRWNRVAVGLSGGVSLAGTLAGLVAAFAAAGLAGWLYQLNWAGVLAIGAVGFIGMLVDSVLGSRWQALYQLPNGAFAETPEAGSRLVKGKAWCTNHAVNLLSNTLTISLIILFFYFLTQLECVKSVFSPTH
jgi:uncharacterized protein (TIGR00297 family)